MSPLCIGSQNGNLEIVKHLVQADTHKDKAAEAGVSSLYNGSAKGHFEMMKHLVEAGAFFSQRLLDQSHAGPHRWENATYPAFCSNPKGLNCLCKPLQIIILSNKCITQ